MMRNFDDHDENEFCKISIDAIFPLWTAAQSYWNQNDLCYAPKFWLSLFHKTCLQVMECKNQNISIIIIISQPKLKENTYLINFKDLLC